MSAEVTTFVIAVIAGALTSALLAPFARRIGRRTAERAHVRKVANSIAAEWRALPFATQQDLIHRHPRFGSEVDWLAECQRRGYLS